MNFEEYFDKLQKAWQCQHPSAKLTINANADVLLKEVRRNQQQFRTTIFWRDVREVGASAVLAVVSLACGIRWHWWSLAASLKRRRARRHRALAQTLQIVRKPREPKPGE